MLDSAQTELSDTAMQRQNGELRRARIRRKDFDLPPTQVLDSMRGDATPFTHRDEVVEAEWRIITPIEEAWARLPATDQPRGMPDGNPAIQR